MLRIATPQLRAGIPFGGVIYAHQRTPIGRCVDDLHLISEVETLKDYADFVRYLPL